MYIYLSCILDETNRRNNIQSRAKKFLFLMLIKDMEEGAKRGIDCLFLEDQLLYFKFVFNLFLTNSFSIYLHS
jgi:hypothetical protein